MASISDGVTAGQGSSGQTSVLAPAPAVLKKLRPDQILQLNQILSEPIEYVNDESFTKTNGGSATKNAADARPWCNAAQTGLAAVAASHTFTISEEHKLFLRFNYARYRLVEVLQRFAHKRLTAKAVEELLHWHKDALTTRDSIVKANMPLVLAMAKRTRLNNVDFMELISEGNMALLRSVEKFDCSRGFKFSTYACRAILKSFSRVAMRTSRYRGRFPTEFDPTLEQSNYQEEVREELEADCVDELRSIIKQNTAALNEVEAKVLQARFALSAVDGAPGDAPKTLEQVGLLIGVTKERVRQIQNRALEKIRLKLQEDFLAA